MQWLIHSTAGLIARILAGAIIFVVLALVDLKKRGAEATRWREYLFLLTCVLAAMLYGVINDQITSAISWEYFYYGKELKDVVGPTIPPDRAAMRWQAAKIGATATWSAGLLIGAAILIANNPRKGVPQLKYRSLLLALLPLFGMTVMCAVAFGFAGSLGWLDWISSDFRLLRETNSFRPARFMATYGVHLGGYIGGAIGTVVTVGCVLLHRKKLFQKSPAHQ